MNSNPHTLSPLIYFTLLPIYYCEFNDEPKYFITTPAKYAGLPASCSCNLNLITINDPFRVLPLIKPSIELTSPKNGAFHCPSVLLKSAEIKLLCCGVDP